MRSGEITDSLRMGRNSPEVSDMQIDNISDCGDKTDAHSLRRQVGMGSELDCLLGSLKVSCRFQIPYRGGIETGEIRRCCRRRR